MPEWFRETLAQVFWPGLSNSTNGRPPVYAPMPQFRKSSATRSSRKHAPIPTIDLLAAAFGACKGQERDGACARTRKPKPRPAENPGQPLFAWGERCRVVLEAYTLQ